MNIFAFKRFCTLQGFRKYKNEVSSPSNSIVIESERFYRASADSNPLLPVQVWWKNVSRIFSSKKVTGCNNSKTKLIPLFQLKIFDKIDLGFIAPISETPWPNVPIKRPLERSSLLYVCAKNQLDCSISSTSYVMDKTHNFRKNKNKTRLNFASKTVHLDWYLNLTFEGHPRSKIFSPFDSPYMTSYLISIDTFSLSRTVFEIFDFKIFRVWLWPFTFRGHLRSNIFSPFESPYITSYSNPIDTFSLSRNVFEIFDFEGIRVWSWPLTFEGWPWVKNISTIWKPIYDFLFNSHWHFLSISYRFREIRLQSF